MPERFAFAPLVARASHSSEILRSIARIAPILVEDKDVSLVPAGAEYWVHLGKQATEQDAIKALDGGAAKILVEAGDSFESLPADRVVQIYSELPSDFGSSTAVCLNEELGLDAAKVAEARKRLGKADEKTLLVIRSQIKTRFPEFATLAAHGATPIIPASEIEELEASEGFLGGFFFSRLRSDRQDGLVPTVVQSVSGASLGLVYSSLASLSASINDSEARATSRNELWTKGATSGAYQRVHYIRTDCDGDALEFVVEPIKPIGVESHFCHTGRSAACFGPESGLAKLERTLLERMDIAPKGSYTARLFSDRALLEAKIREEADEVCRATTKEETAAEAADLLYFLLARCATQGVRLADVEAVLDQRASKVTRRPGNAKPAFTNGAAEKAMAATATALPATALAAAEINPSQSTSEDIVIPQFDLTQLNADQYDALLKRPLVASAEMIGRVKPIIDAVRTDGDKALRQHIAKLDRCNPAQSDANWPVVLEAPFAPELMKLDGGTKAAIDRAYDNIAAFHGAQMDRERKELVVETMPGVVCKRQCRPIDRVGLYVPGGTAVLPSTALMLAIPASIAGCSRISIATPSIPADGSIRPEIVYIAHRCGVQQIVKAGGAHAVAALAYGTESVGKVDKIFGPGNQWVTAAKMAVSMDAGAGVGIDMPAGPSEVLVIADETSNPAFVAADLLSQAEHGPDSQVVLLTVALDPDQIRQIQREVHVQATQLPRVDVVRQCISKSIVLRCPNLEAATNFSNDYAPEHLILHLRDPAALMPSIRNAGSVFLGEWSPESCGDYASGTNHTLPT